MPSWPCPLSLGGQRDPAAEAGTPPCARQWHLTPWTGPLTTGCHRVAAVAVRTPCRNDQSVDRSVGRAPQDIPSLGPDAQWPTHRPRPLRPRLPVAARPVEGALTLDALWRRAAHAQQPRAPDRPRERRPGQERRAHRHGHGKQFLTAVVGGSSALD